MKQVLILKNTTLTGIREDLADLENVKDLGIIEKMVLSLPDLVGSPLSINALREDLQVSHQSVSRWIAMLENLYIIFRIYPFGAPKIRAVKKEASGFVKPTFFSLISSKGLNNEFLTSGYYYAESGRTQPSVRAICPNPPLGHRGNTLKKISPITQMGDSMRPILCII